MNGLKKYTVWCGGVEVNSRYLSLDDAKKVAKEYEDEGYDDVKLEKAYYELKGDK